MCQDLYSEKTPCARGGGGERGLPYKSDRDARQKIQIKLLREANMGVAQAETDLKGDFCVVIVKAFFVNFFMHSPKQDLNGQI